MPSIPVHLAKRLLLPLVLLFSAILLLGALITRVFARVWPFTAEDGVNRALVAHGSHAADAVTFAFSTVGGTPTIVAVTALAALVLRLVLHRWREPLFLIAAVSAQALIFLVTSLAIDRHRPEVRHLDDSPPTSSFPSGHTSAATALYVGLALLLAAQVQRRSWKVAVWTVLVLVPLSVAVSRMYRGMHHPSDVLASFLNGSMCVLIMARAILDPTVKWTRTTATTVGSHRSTTPAAVKAGRRQP